MTSTRKTVNENWLLVEWNSGGRDVVYVRSVVSPVNKALTAGDVLTVNRRGQHEKATLIARARERDMLDCMLNREEPGPSRQQQPGEEEGEDFSSSASSWEPSDDGALSGDSTEVKKKKIKLERYKRQYSNRRSSRKITPSNKANAVLNTMNRKRLFNESQKNTENLSMNTLAPDSTRNQNVGKKVMVDVQDLVDISNTFTMLFKVLHEMKQSLGSEGSTSPESHQPSITNTDDTLINDSYSQMHQSLDEDKENENDVSENDEFNRSDDNVLISNKYSNAGVRTVEARQARDDEWVPIGSGMTLIHKDKFKQINWKSYTIATRTLLLAVFPRRVLATHSLTGKRSPAFQNKPAKMCLDPKIVSDVIMEIMDRFNVRENLVRTIITTKCADECKMWKMRIKKKKAIKNQEEAGASHSQQSQV